MLSILEYIYGRSSARTYGHSLAVQQWQAMPDASPIEPERKYKCLFALEQHGR